MSESSGRVNSPAVGRDLRDALATLKREGCGLLVTGRVRPEVAQLMSQRLFGDPNRARTRILVAADESGVDLSRYLPLGIGPSHENLRIFGLAAEARAGTTVQSSEPVERSDVTVESLDELRAVTSEHLQDVGGADAETPGHVRLGLVGLRHLFDAYPEAAVREFVTETTARIRRLQGMAHFHLQLPDDHDLVADLTDVVDGRIELRTTTDAGSRYRWHLPDCGSSDWLPCRQNPK